MVGAIILSLFIIFILGYVYKDSEFKFFLIYMCMCVNIFLVEVCLEVFCSFICSLDFRGFIFFVW